MAQLGYSFVMQEPPAEAAARFGSELGVTLQRMGFKPAESSADHLVYVPRSGAGWIPVLGLGLLYVWVARRLLGHRIDVAFLADEERCRVEITGRAPRGVSDQLRLLGLSSHWPANRDDPIWLPEATDDPYADWDDASAEDLELSDRTTRRALRKAGRLPR